MRPTWKAPATYREWHQLREYEIWWLGLHTSSLYEFRFDRELAPMVNEAQLPRKVWRAFRRVQRIEARMEQCVAENCPTWNEHLTEMERSR